MKNYNTNIIFSVILFGLTLTCSAQRYVLNAFPNERIEYPGKVRSPWQGSAVTATVDISLGNIIVTGSPERFLKIVSQDTTYVNKQYRVSYYFRCTDQNNHKCGFTLDLPEKITQHGVMGIGYGNRSYIYSVTLQSK